MKIALLAGTTGLIGSQLLDILLNDARYERVIALSRQPLTQTHPRLVNLIVDFKTLRDYAPQLKADDVFCCLGTTMKQAKSKDAFRQVDYEYPLALAKITKAQGANSFCLVSALGVDANSSVFYNRVKGEVELAIRDCHFERTHVFRPSLLFGPRKEQRTGEDAAKFVFRYLGFLIPSKFKAIESIKVARAMAFYANDNSKGYFVHESAALQVF